MKPSPRRTKILRLQRLRKRADALMATGRESDRRRAMQMFERVATLASEVIAEVEALDPVLRFLVGKDLPRC